LPGGPPGKCTGGNQDKQGEGDGEIENRAHRHRKLLRVLSIETEDVTRESGDDIVASEAVPAPV